MPNKEQIQEEIISKQDELIKILKEQIAIYERIKGFQEEMIKNLQAVIELRK